MLEGCQVLNSQLEYIYLNNAVLMHAKKSKEELLGCKIFDVYPGIENTELYNKLMLCLNESLSFEIENKFGYPDGSIGWFLLKISPVENGVFILSVDITAEKKAVSEKNRRIEHLTALREIDQTIISITDLQICLKNILHQVMLSLKVDAAGILLLNKFSPLLEYYTGQGFLTSEIKKTRLFVGQGVTGKAVQNLESISCRDLRKESSAFVRSSIFNSEGFVSYCADPLVSKGKTIGLLEVFTRSSCSFDPIWYDFFHALSGQISIAIENGQLFENLQRSKMNLELTYNITIEGWSKALDLRDQETEGHTLRVTEKTIELARLAGVPEQKIVHIRRGALLHDIGKMVLPDSILLKPGPLTNEEWEVMKTHPVVARDLIRPIEYLRQAIPIPYSHHEKWDGSGYPQGLKSKSIPFAARLFAVVDVWDALSHERPYKAAWSQDKVFDYIKAESGKHFDPEVVELFFKSF